MAKLTKEHVKDIVTALQAGISGTELSVTYGVSKGRISQIKKENVMKPKVDVLEVDSVGNPVRST